MYLAHDDRKLVGDRYNAACLAQVISLEAGELFAKLFSRLTFQGTMSTMYGAPLAARQHTE